MSEKIRADFEDWFKYNYSWFIGQGSPQHGIERFNEHGLPGYAREIAHHDWRVWQACNESLKAENESLRKDAERYRWLRENSYDIGSYHPEYEYNANSWFEYLDDEDIDTAIADALKDSPENL
jgi:hypothetical protein